MTRLVRHYGGWAEAAIYLSTVVVALIALVTPSRAMQGAAAGMLMITSLHGLSKSPPTASERPALTAGWARTVVTVLLLLLVVALAITVLIELGWLIAREGSS